MLAPREAPGREPSAQAGRSRLIAWSLFGLVALFFAGTLVRMNADVVAGLPWGAVFILLGMTVTIPWPGSGAAFAVALLIAGRDILFGPSRLMQAIEIVVLLIVAVQLFGQWRANRKGPA